MLLFKKVQDRNPDGTNLLSITGRCKIFNQSVATYLQRKSEKLSSRLKKYVLVCFCLLFGGSSVAIIIQSATSTDQVFSTVSISKPVSSFQDEKNYMQTDSSIKKLEYNKVEQFKTYLLHLKNDSTSRYKFDSILQAWPKLIDSINLFEKIYLEQK